MAAPYSYNPFLGPPPPDPNDLAARFRRETPDMVRQPPATRLGPPPANPFHGQGPLMSLGDQAAVEKAPKLPGTTVTVEAYPVGPSFDPANHMYVQFDDGRERYIYRGGPNSDGSLGAGVVPAHLSRDYGKGQDLYQTFLPNVSAVQAIRPAQADADRINGSDNPYAALTSNSNSIVGDYTARQYGHRVGNSVWDRIFSGKSWTPGASYDLPDHSPIPDLTPVIASPF
jgi:hypothetical protein